MPRSHFACVLVLVAGCFGTYTPVGTGGTETSGADDGGDAGDDGSADDGADGSASGSGDTTGGADDGTTSGVGDDGTTSTTGDDTTAGTTGAFDCDAWNQDCPDDGDKCVAPDDDSDETMCVPGGDGLPGATCMPDPAGPEGTDTCDVESQCYLFDNMNDGFCTPFCGPAPGLACDNNGYCIPSPNGEVGHCVQPCDPLQADDCDSQYFSCKLIHTGNQGQQARVYGCVPLASGANRLTGESCDAQRDCIAGHYCLAGTMFDCVTNDCCAPFCDVTEDPDPCLVHGPQFECQGGSVGGINASPDLGVCTFAP